MPGSGTPSLESTLSIGVPGGQLVTAPVSDAPKYALVAGGGIAAGARARRAAGTAAPPQRNVRRAPNASAPSRSASATASTSSGVGPAVNRQPYRRVR